MVSFYLVIREFSGEVLGKLERGIQSKSAPARPVTPTARVFAFIWVGTPAITANSGLFAYRGWSL